MTLKVKSSILLT